jgi:cob(I)alamin adenosyltransferase
MAPSVISLGACPKLKEELTQIQNDLFHLGADLSIPEGDKAKFPAPTIELRHISYLEGLIDELTAVVGPLNNFILPSGTAPAAQLHIARTVCRRAERDVVSLAQEETVSTIILNYLNRLSDALFVMARFENYQKNVPEKQWNSRA